MLGDNQVTLPGYEATLGVTINAAPADIWPWLLQMGYRRGGLYSYDWLDRLFGYLDAPSAERILPEWQTLAIGDEIPVGRGGGFRVKAIEPFRSLVLGGCHPNAAAASGTRASGRDVEWSWELALVPVGDRRTRLLSRNRVRTRRTLRSVLTMSVIEPAAFLMTRKMLLGLKRRAEAFARTERRVA